MDLNKIYQCGVCGGSGELENQCPICKGTGIAPRWDDSEKRLLFEGMIGTKLLLERKGNSEHMLVERMIDDIVPWKEIEELL